MITFRVQEVARSKGVKNVLQLAVRCDVSQMTAHKLWTGKVNESGTGVGVFTLHKVAKALGVRVADLIVEHDSVDELQLAS